MLEFQTYPIVDYSLIADAIQYYQELGYKYIAVPWRVPDDVVKITSPDTTRQDIIGEDGLSLVASAEQSFLHMMLSGELGEGMYVACTPCFRDDEQTNIHFPYFMKVELIHIDPENSPLGRTLMIEHVWDFFTEKSGAVCDLTGFGSEYDLNINGVEVGSYGDRIIMGRNYIYGTGLAEPRFSIAVREAIDIM